ncbi:hypothetical protein MBLNU230_g1261t1 [Neophaeotheca triangularis]
MAQDFGDSDAHRLHLKADMIKKFEDSDPPFNAKGKFVDGNPHPVVDPEFAGQLHALNQQALDSDVDMDDAEPFTTPMQVAEKTKKKQEEDEEDEESKPTDMQPTTRSSSGKRKLHGINESHAETPLKKKSKLTLDDLPEQRDLSKKSPAQQKAKDKRQKVKKSNSATDQTPKLKTDAAEMEAAKAKVVKAKVVKGADAAAAEDADKGQKYDLAAWGRRSATMSWTKVDGKPAGKIPTTPASRRSDWLKYRVRGGKLAFDLWDLEQRRGVMPGVERGFGFGVLPSPASKPASQQTPRPAQLSSLSLDGSKKGAGIKRELGTQLARLCTTAKNLMPAVGSGPSTDARSRLEQIRQRAQGSVNLDTLVRQATSAIDGALLGLEAGQMTVAGFSVLPMSSAMGDLGSEIRELRNRLRKAETAYLERKTTAMNELRSCRDAIAALL